MAETRKQPRRHAVREPLRDLRQRDQLAQIAARYYAIEEIPVGMVWRVVGKLRNQPPIAGQEDPAAMPGTITLRRYAQAKAPLGRSSIKD